MKLSRGIPQSERASQGEDSVLMRLNLGQTPSAMLMRTNDSEDGPVDIGFVCSGCGTSYPYATLCEICSVSYTHLLLAHYLAGGKSEDKEYYERLCEHSSAMEVRAADAERASIKYKMVEFMLDKLDQEFDGHISGITEWGIYVELEDTKIEGMVALRDMTDDFYVFDEEN